MANATAAWAVVDAGPPNRRLAAGVLVSLLLHAIVLSLQFGIPGLRPGTGGSLTVHLAPRPAPSSAQAVTPAPTLPVPAPGTQPDPIVPMAPARPLTTSPPRAREGPHARQGFSVLDPIRPQPAPQVVARPPATRARRAPRRHARVPAAHDGLHARVIAQDAHKDDGFKVPPATSEPPAVADAREKIERRADPAAPDSSLAQQAEAPVADQETAESQAVQEQQAERERLAAQREQAREQARADEEQALRNALDTEARRATEQQARVLAQQDANYQDELARRQRQAEEDRRLAEEALARRRAEEAQREETVREQAAQAAQAARQLAEQERLQAEQQRAQQLAQEQRIRAAEQQRIQAEQARAQQLAEQRDAEERQRQAQAREQAEQLAREQATQAARTATPATDGGHGGADADGTGGSGAAPSGGPQGANLVSRARELLRGIDIDKPIPHAMRPAEDARRNARRALAAAESHNVPLRLYVDSVRQKIERNAIVGISSLSADAVRIFPIVSIAIRSDGSVEDVVIVRSSGHAEIDETVRRIVRLNARYAAFPPNVAANYDVVEVRRVWSFSGVLRLLEEMR